MKKTKVCEGKDLILSIYNLSIEGKKVERVIIEHRDVAAILAFDENNKVILVKQHRFSHGYILEMPAGTLKKGEDPKKCAFREIKEETGYKATKLTHLITYYPSVGYNREKVHCFLASKVEKIGDLSLDEDEFITVVKIDLKKLLNLIKKGKIIDSKTICAIFAYLAKKNFVL